jgi:hypothetical protein
MWPQAFAAHRIAATSAKDKRIAELEALLVRTAATVNQSAAGTWAFDLGDPEQLMSDICEAVGCDTVIAARKALTP